MMKEGALGHGAEPSEPCPFPRFFFLSWRLCPHEILLYDVPIKPLGLFFTAWDVSAMWASIHL